MRILTIYAHHDPRSFCHAVLERFTDGLRDAGHANEVVDLHAIRFDPVIHDRDAPAMKVLIDDYALRYPGIKRIEHEYFHAVHGADEATRRAYLDRAYRLGREF